MKKIIKVITLLAIILPMSLFAHTGHEHTGTFWENVVHFMVTNSYLFVAAFFVGAYLLYKNRKIAGKVKNTSN